jgi:hypothetical protein
MLNLSLSYPGVTIAERMHAFHVYKVGEGVVARHWSGVLVLAGP